MPATRRRPPLDVEALWALRRVGAPTVSPDGALACAAVTSYDMERNEGSTALWLFPTGLAERKGATARKLTEGDKDSEPAWSPDGRFIAFTAKRKDDAEPQVYLIAPDGGEARRLTSVLRPVPRRSSGSRTASGSRSCRGCGRISPPTRSRGSG